MDVRDYIQGRRLFQIFSPKGDGYSRGAMNRRTDIIRINVVLLRGMFFFVKNSN